MIRDLVIVGAGGTSRMIAEAVEDINADRRRWQLLGFLDDDPAKQGREVQGLPVLGSISTAATLRSAHFIIGIANYRNPLARRDVELRMGFSRERFATVVHTSAVVSRHARLGRGTAVLPNAVIAPAAEVGCHVIVSRLCSLGHDSVVADYVTLTPGACISGSARLGLGAFLGSRSVVREGIQIGEGSVVGLGAVVVNDVAPFATVVGCPAQPLERRQQASPDSTDPLYPA
jgi:sugar O-acyltransferase (sialic acid O-acetyltransferase NeuD family)